MNPQNKNNRNFEKKSFKNISTKFRSKKNIILILYYLK